MKKIFLAIAMLSAMAACTDEKNPVYEFPARPDVEPLPAVKITAGVAEQYALEVTISPKNAEECAYYCIETVDDDKQLTAGEVISLGTAADATEEGTYRIEGLYDNTEYNIYAAVRKGDKASINVIKMATTEGEVIIPEGPKTNPMYLWVDAAANFPDFANSKENIRRDLTLAKETGFTDIVVDVRPTNGDVLFTTTHCDQVAWLGAWVTGQGYKKIERTADWDYLGAFIEIGHELGLRIHAGFNTMVGGNTSEHGSQGILVRDSSKKEWATVLNTTDGFVNTLDSEETTWFMNPHNAEVQEYICNLLKDLAAYTDLDGIILDRGRFDSLLSDCSTSTLEEFEEYVGTTVDFNADVLPAGHSGTVGNLLSSKKHLKKWLEFRVKTIHDLMTKAKEAVRSVNSTVKFGVYVGGWYSTYYDVGVNWASPSYDTSYEYKWATADYMNYGYADLMDHMLIGAYASPGKVYGSTEWTMQGFCQLAMKYTAGACPQVCGGPDVGNWDYEDNFSDAQEYEAITNSVKACYDACNGYFLFDMIHLKKGNLWQYAKAGIDEVKAEL